MSETLISPQGPLATVWLAANYDKKLHKQQLLQADIPELTELISSNQITLRLSGLLLLGVVRIYSRKTKYLLDDVNDILVKLKTSFKYSTGSRLGSDGTSVNLPASQTVIKNIKLVMLTDQVSRYDLFYQPDLNLDLPQVFLLTSQYDLSQFDTQYDDHLVDPGRSHDDGAGEQDVMLDFDIDMPDMDDDHCGDEPPLSPSGPDQSIEIGRRGLVVEQAPEEISILDMDKPEEPLETVEEAQRQATPPPTRAPRRRRQAMIDGHVNTNKRRLIVDEETVISVDSLREFQASTMALEPRQTVAPTERLRAIYEVAYKRRRLQWEAQPEAPADIPENIDLPEIGHEPESEVPLPLNLDQHLDFDIDIPDIEPPHDDYEDQQPPVFASDDSGSSSVDMEHQMVVTLTEKLDESRPTESTTLASVIDASSASVPATRKHAALCFFQMLTLATNDAIHIDQAPSATELGGAIDISAKPRLWTLA